MPSKSVGGFDLILGDLYNDYWFNAGAIQHSAVACTKCRGAASIHSLEKLVFAFGKMTVKHCEVHTCPDCLHEHIAVPPEKAFLRYKPATKANLVKLFAKLPKAVQQELLMNRR